MKVHNKGKNNRDNDKKVVKSYITDKAKNKIKNNLKNQVIKIQKKPTANNVSKLNSIILGVHNYYNVATNVSLDFKEISYIVNKSIYNRTKTIRSKNGTKTKCYEKFYGGYNGKTSYICNIALFPIYGIKTKPPRGFVQDICNYTKEGREKIHKNIQNVSIHIQRHLMKNWIHNKSIEYNDNRVSLYVGQNGICPISNEFLEIGNMECHHKIPIVFNGTDEYSNLIFLKTEIHKLIHATTNETINKYLQILNFDKNALKKLNKLRKLVGNFEI